MKTITGESFEVSLDQHRATVVFKGALRLTGSEDYAPILEIMQQTLASGVAPIVIDLRSLEFLNSSGITMLSRFVIEARDRKDIEIEVIASETTPWHARSLRNLQRLMPTLTVRLM